MCWENSRLELPPPVSDLSPSFLSSIDFCGFSAFGRFLIIAHILSFLLSPSRSADPRHILCGRSPLIGSGIPLTPSIGVGSGPGVSPRRRPTAVSLKKFFWHSFLALKRLLAVFSVVVKQLLLIFVFIAGALRLQDAGFIHSGSESRSIDHCDCIKPPSKMTPPVSEPLSEEEECLDNTLPQIGSN